MDSRVALPAPLALSSGCKLARFAKTEAIWELMRARAGLGRESLDKRVSGSGPHASNFRGADTSEERCHARAYMQLEGPASLQFNVKSMPSAVPGLTLNSTFLCSTRVR